MREHVLAHLATDDAEVLSPMVTFEPKKRPFSYQSNPVLEPFIARRVYWLRGQREASICRFRAPCSHAIGIALA